MSTGDGHAREREQAEDLRRSEERYRLASLATSDAIWDWDLRADALSWNESVEALFGHPREELGTIAAWYERLHPDDRDRVVRGLHLAVDSGESRWEDEYRFRRRDGTWALVHDRAYVARDAGGRAVRMVGAMQDRTEQHRAQTERDRLFLLAVDPLCVAGLDGYFKRVNPAFTRVLGYATEEILRVPVVSLVHPDDVASTLAAMETLRGGTPVVHFENRYRRRDGSYRWLAWSSSPDPDAGVTYAAARDVTEQKLAAAEARQRADFEQQLIGIVSHDLRSPITTILLDATALERRALGDAAARSAARIRAAAGRAHRLIDDLLDFTVARLGGGIPVRPRPADLHDLARRIVDEVRVNHPERRFEVRAEGDGHGRWDPDRLAQVVANLATNAAKYGAPDGPVTMTTRGEADAVVLEVHNEGEPIPEADQERLFEPMTRGSSRDVEHRARSVGLGLYIVRSIVTAHGGTIAVRSRRGEGTTFAVRLPRAPAPSAREAAAAAAPVLDVASVPQVALAFQNEDHAEEARLLNVLGEAVAAYRETGRAADVHAALLALLAHTREHFERENAAMRDAGFPAYPVHSGEHARVLAEMEAEARAFEEKGDAARLWSYVASVVPAWFVHHIQTMDAVTGRFVAARAG